MRRSSGPAGVAGRLVTDQSEVAANISEVFDNMANSGGLAD